MASRPLALPEIFTGEGRQSFTDWIDHFESIATVNEWTDDAKKNWIRARLTGRAATAWKRLTEADLDSYEHIVAALKKRFEPECRKEVYMAEFQRRRKLPAEDWASFAEDLRTLVEKAYPTLQAEAQELLALNHFLQCVTNMQLAFGVRQRAPATLEAAVAATLELETYLHKPDMTIASVGDCDPPNGELIAASSKLSMEDSLQKLIERMDRLEGKLKSSSSGSQTRGTQRGHGRDEEWGRNRGKKKLTCWNCLEEGHFARNCKNAAAKEQGNDKPLGQ